MHRLGELGEELGFLDRLLIDSHDRHFAVAVKGAITRRAVAHAPPQVRVLTLE